MGRILTLCLKKGYILPLVWVRKSDEEAGGSEFWLVIITEEVGDDHSDRESD